MRLSLQTWDYGGAAYDINSATYEPVIEPGNAMPAATATFIDLGQGDPILAGKVLDGGYFTFTIVLKGNVETSRDELNKWFRPNDFTFRKLLAYDLDNSNKPWYLEGYPVTPPMPGEGAVAKYSITLALKQPYWIEADLQTNTWSITADTETQAITATGNMPAMPLFEITPILAKASNDLKYKTFYAIHTSGYGATKLPVDITDGGLDTATLTTAKMRADGNDVGVSINGVYVDRWFGEGSHAFDTADTTIWVNMNFSPAPTMELNVALAGAGVPATLKVTYTNTNGTPNGAILLPQNSTLQIGNELITYSSYTVDQATQTITFVPVARNAKGSSIAAHSIGDDVFWIENEVWLTYGNASATAPVVNDVNKPILDLAASTNDEWVYLVFGTANNLRSGAPNKSGVVFLRNSVAGWYTGVNGANADPYTEIGFKVASYMQGSEAKIDNSTHLEWTFNHPGGISNFECNGEKYRSGENWPSLIISTIPIKWGGGSIYSTIATPSVVETWEPIAEDVATTGNPPYIYFGIAGGLGTTLPAPYAMAELNDVTLEIFDPPTITPLGIEQANYKLSGSLENDTTGDTILFLDLVTKTGVTLYIDCDTQEVYSADGQRVRGMIGFSGAKRDEWMTLVSGANSIIFTDTGTVELTIVTKWRGRNTI